MYDVLKGCFVLCRLLAQSSENTKQKTTLQNQHGQPQREPTMKTASPQYTPPQWDVRTHPKGVAHITIGDMFCGVIYKK